MTRINGEPASIVWQDDIVIITFRGEPYTFPRSVRIVDICKALGINALRVEVGRNDLP